jgi:hypothetical protein
MWRQEQSSGRVTKGAMMSECRLYRYRLWRCWGDGNRRVCFVGINPSTADETKDDATIRKCMGFAKRWGFGALDMVNLFAWRDRDQLGLLSSLDPVGPDNNAMLSESFGFAQRIVYAWGPGKSAAVGRLVRCRLDSPGWATAESSRRPGCELGRLHETADGSPGHPLLLPYSTPFTAIERK